MIINRHTYAFFLLLVSGAPALFAADEAAAAAGDAAATVPGSAVTAAPSNSPSDLELLRAQVALQQQQIQQLRNALDAQQRQLDQLARAIPGNPERVELASLTPVSISGPVARASATIPYWTASAMAMPPAPLPQEAAPGARPVSTSLGVAPAAAAAIAPGKQGPGIIPHTHEQEHAEVRQPKKWYEKYSFRGYTQLRHNRLVQTNNELICAQCDGSTANNNNFIFRRARFVLSGEISDQVSIYFQPDFAVTNTNLHFAQVRDLYFDIALDKKKEFRFRVGQSKVPYSFENLQSSQNRLALDRNDATNSAFANERDLGVFFYWAPAHIRARFNELTTKGLKGSGDYGVLGTGIYNGQILNSPEQNNDLHYSWRATYPWKLRNGQFIEAGVQAYTGKFTVATRTAATRGNPGFRYNDRRAAASLIVYPQPFGLQTEWNLGTGPEYNRLTRFIDQKSLGGGYVQLMYMKRFANGSIVTPFYRFTAYGGGKKQEIDARHYVVRDSDLGIEWQPNHYLELVMQYGRGFRIFEDAARPNWRQTGHQLRVQLQINY
jgi:Phosphate-selective porin O and P